MTMIDLMRRLNNAGVRVAVRGGCLHLSGNADADLRSAVAEHEADLVALLSPAGPDDGAGVRAAVVEEGYGALDAGPATAEWDAWRSQDHGFLDWRLEWLTELGGLYLITRSCHDPAVLDRLRPLAEATPRNAQEWLTLYQQIAEAERDLRRHGKFPVVPWPDR